MTILHQPGLAQVLTICSGCLRGAPREQEEELSMLYSYSDDEEEEKVLPCYKKYPLPPEPLISVEIGVDEDGNNYSTITMMTRVKKMTKM
jgi:hypothetical protein